MSSNSKSARLSRNILQSPRSSKHSLSYSTSPLSTPTKRRKRDSFNSLGPQRLGASESFIMKLFDRSLDLSKYNENTALYPICRAWIANEPRNPIIANYRNRRSPSPIERTYNGAKLLEQIRRDNTSVVLAMPKPLETELPPILAFKKPDPDRATLDKLMAAGADSNDKQQEAKKDASDGQESKTEQMEIDSQAAKSANETKRNLLLAENMKRWRYINNKWINHSEKYKHKRYSYNFAILEIVCTLDNT